MDKQLFVSAWAIFAYVLIVTGIFVFINIVPDKATYLESSCASSEDKASCMQRYEENNVYMKSVVGSAAYWSAFFVVPGLLLLLQLPLSRSRRTLFISPSVAFILAIILFAQPYLRDMELSALLYFFAGGVSLITAALLTLVGRRIHEQYEPVRDTESKENRVVQRIRSFTKYPWLTGVFVFALIGCIAAFYIPIVFFAPVLVFLNRYLLSTRFLLLPALMILGISIYFWIGAQYFAFSLYFAGIAVATGIAAYLDSQRAH